MRFLLLAVLCAVALKGVAAEGENGVRRGSFPYMAFLYYSDETILENDARFTRSAALISDDWLISSVTVSLAFPQKTLLARVGAISIDTKLTLNEDEDEQEREIITILRPYNYNATQWWKTDISLLKTLFPFNVTSSVAPIPIAINYDTSDNCFILVYASRYNVTERNLIQMNVKLLPPTPETCGNNFEKETMICATDSDKDAVTDPDFCQGNNGGPLICDSEITGLQTYTNDCKQPYLYQLLTVWKQLITCAAEQRYLTQSCADICSVITKDPPIYSSSESPEISETVGETKGETTDETAGETAGETADETAGETVGETASKMTVDTTSEIVDEKIHSVSNTGNTESINTPTKTDATETASTIEVKKPIVTSEKKNKEKRVTTSTPAVVENYSPDKSTAGEVENSDESGRRRLNKPRHKVRSDAMKIVPNKFHYLVTSIICILDIYLDPLIIH